VLATLEQLARQEQRVLLERKEALEPKVPRERLVLQDNPGNPDNPDNPATLVRTERQGKMAYQAQQELRGQPEPKVRLVLRERPEKQEQRAPQVQREIVVKRERRALQALPVLPEQRVLPGVRVI
jgi:hypothetical protein